MSLIFTWRNKFYSQRWIRIKQIKAIGKQSLSTCHLTIFDGIVLNVILPRIYLVYYITLVFGSPSPFPLCKSGNFRLASVWVSLDEIKNIKIIYIRLSVFKKKNIFYKAKSRENNEIYSDRFPFMSKPPKVNFLTMVT